MIVKTPAVSFTNALTGRIAGLQTLQSTGLPGSDVASLTLRGQIPVIVVNGVVTDLTTIDLEEIESVTVLKDALSTTMLGVRGAHGAILVTTKKGNHGRQLISFTAQRAVQQPISWIKTLNSYDYARLHNEALDNDGIDSLNSGLYYSKTAMDAYRNHTDSFNYPDVNYRDAITNRSSFFDRYTLSVTGGDSRARYFVSMEHINQSGFFKTVDSNTYNTNNNFKSYNFSSNIDLNITPKLSGGIYLLGRILNSNQPGATTSAILSNLLNTPSNAYPLLNSDNSFGGTRINQNNLLAQIIGSGYRQQYSRFMLVNIYFDRKLDDILSGLWIKGKVAYNSTLTENIDRSKTFAVYQQIGTSFTKLGINGLQSNSNGISSQGSRDYEELSVGYSHIFKKRHGLNILFLLNRDNSTDIYNAQSLPYTISGGSGRLAYDFKGKYIVEGTFGLNGSNRYPENGSTKLCFFPSVGFGWNIEKEDFLKSYNFISSLKLFVSYGKSGWDNPGYFSYYPRFYTGQSPYFGTGPGTVPSISEGTLANQNVNVEKAHKLNIGLNGAMLKNQITYNIEYYSNTYYDLMQQRGQTNTLLGNTYPYENIGINKYYGYDGQIGWQQLTGKLQYFINLNVSTQQSKVVYMDEVSKPFDYMYFTGKPVGQMFGYVAEGLFQSKSEINSSATTLGYTPHLGDIKYKDLNGDGIIDQNDITVIGTTKPLTFWGISFGVSWKGFDVSALIQGTANRNVYLSGPSYWAFQNGGIGQAYSHNLNRWTLNNTVNATYPRLSYGANSNNDAVSSYWVRNGKYMRLKNLEIGYSIPTSILVKARLQTVRIFINGFNLLTRASSEIDDRDPESYAGNYPIQRLYNFGINIKF